MGTPEGWLGEGRSSYTQRDPHMVRGPVQGKPWGRRCGRGTKEQKGMGASAFPIHLGTGKSVGLPGLILCPRSLPPAPQSPSPTLTPPPRALPLHLEIPSNELGLNPTHTPSLRALPPNSRIPRSGGPPFHLLPLPFCRGLKHRPMLEHHPA